MLAYIPTDKIVHSGYRYGDGKRSECVSGRGGFSGSADGNCGCGRGSIDSRGNGNGKDLNFGSCAAK